MLARLSGKISDVADQFINLFKAEGDDESQNLAKKAKKLMDDEDFDENHELLNKEKLKKIDEKYQNKDDL